jgi:PIN domain nuclease of toxin-antitoxin system
MTADKRQLSTAAAEAIREESRAGKGVAIASSTLWEIAMMSARNELRLPGTLTEYLSYVEAVFVVLPITGAIAERSVLFTGVFPNDPTDRLIGATAVVHGIRLVTKDKKIRTSKQVDCIW